MSKAVLLVFIATFAPQAATARGGLKMVGSIPEIYWGTWAAGPCKDGDKTTIVLSAKAYAGPLGKCDVESVSETPSPKGPTYSARLQCAQLGQAQKTPANLIIRSVEANQISVGPGFNRPKAHQRCSESPPSSK